MMTPIESQWSVLSWERYDAEPPTAPPQRFISGDGRKLEIHDQIDPDWHRAHVRYGAEIHDHDRDVTYRATVAPDTGDLDHLEVVVHGRIDDNVARRVPVARIRREVLRQVAADVRARVEAGHDSVWTIVLPGGLSDRPDLDEVAQLIREGRDRAWFHAAYPDVPKRTVDGWMSRARKKHNDVKIPPSPKSAPEIRARYKQRHEGQTK